jgi:ATP-dependent Zn protease
MQYNVAKSLLKKNAAKVEIMAQMLLDKETIDANDIDKIMKTETVIKPEKDA